MWTSPASSAEAADSAPTTFAGLFVAAGPACQDGDTAVMQAGFSEPLAGLSVFCSLTLDLNGQDLTLAKLTVQKSITIKDTAGGGSLVVNNAGGPGIQVAVGTTLSIESGTVTATGNGSGIL